MVTGMALSKESPISRVLMLLGMALKMEDLIALQLCLASAEVLRVKLNGNSISLLSVGLSDGAFEKEDGTSVFNKDDLNDDWADGVPVASSDGRFDGVVDGKIEGRAFKCMNRL
jgi:hypothetical protein